MYAYVKSKEKTSSTLNTTDTPNHMKTRFEKSSGFSLDDVRVQYNSDKPAQWQALAYTQGITGATGYDDHTLENHAISTQKQSLIVQRVKSSQKEVIAGMYTARTGVTISGGLAWRALSVKNGPPIKDLNEDEAVDLLENNAVVNAELQRLLGRLAQPDTPIVAAEPAPPEHSVLDDQMWSTVQIDLGPVGTALIKIRPRDPATRSTKLVLFAHGRQFTGESIAKDEGIAHDFAYMVPKGAAMSRATADYGIIGRHASAYEELIDAGIACFEMRTFPLVFLGSHNGIEIGDLMNFVPMIPDTFDVAFLTDLIINKSTAENAEYSKDEKVPLESILTGNSGELHAKYKSFLIASCRSEWPVKGLGSSPVAVVPNGLYNTDDVAISRT